MAAYNFLRNQEIALPKFLEIRDAGFKLLPLRWQKAAEGQENLRLESLLSELLQHFELHDVRPNFVAGAAEAYQSAVRAHASLMPAARETLAWVKSAGYRIGLLSNTMFTGAAHIEDLDRFGLSGYFDTMLFSADVNKWKPTAEPFLHVLGELDVAPDAAVYVGDDPDSDVVGGHHAGMYTIHIKTSPRFPSSNSVLPDAQINDLSELPPLLKEWERSVNP
jgi:putative hydrolase of the HAD superfamily